MRQIKVLEICAVSFTVKNFLLPLIDRLITERYEVHTLCSDGPEILDLERKGYIIKRVHITRRISPLSHIFALIRMTLYMRKERFDVVHVHTPIAAVLGRIAARLAGVPIILYTAHGFYFHDAMPAWKRKIIMWLEKIMGQYFSDFIFTQSAEDAKIAITEKISTPGKVLHINNGIDVCKFNPSLQQDFRLSRREEFGFNDKDKVIVFVGRLVKEKGIIDLVKAFHTIADTDDTAKLLIIGDNTADERDLQTKEELQKLTGSPNVREKIIFAGYRHDLHELLTAVDLLVLPSYREGMPRSIIEAMAMAKPVVATNIRGCREEVVDGVTGFLVPVNNPDRLAKAILTILKDEKMAKDMGETARQRVLSEFDEKLVLDRQISVFARLCASRSLR